MKKLYGIFVLPLVFVFLSTSVLAYTAKAGHAKRGPDLETPNVEMQDTGDESNSMNGNENMGAGNSKNRNKGEKEKKYKPQNDLWKAAKDAVEAEKDAIEAQKAVMEEQKDSLEAQYEAAIEAGDLSLAQELLTQIEKIKADIDLAKQQMNQLKMQMKEIIRNRYTVEELARLREIAEEITENDQEAEVIPVENIITDGVDIVFDTPPVVKYGRILVPVRALSEAYGAQVQWVGEEKKVVITKGDKEIILQLDSNIALINGVETPLDVPAQSINRRTVVPLRFIVENLGLKVEWDQETGIVEIENPVQDTGI